MPFTFTDIQSCHVIGLLVMLNFVDSTLVAAVIGGLELTGSSSSLPMTSSLPLNSTDFFSSTSFAHAVRGKKGACK